MHIWKGGPRAARIWTRWACGLLITRSVPASASTFPIDAALVADRQTPTVWYRRIDRATLYVALVVVALNLVDAFCTLHHVSLGAEEVNPLMKALIDRGDYSFLVGKHLLASGGVLGIVAHCEHAIARKMLKFVLLPIYLAIAVYQISLFAWI